MKNLIVCLCMFVMLIPNAFSKKKQHCFKEIFKVSFEGNTYSFRIDACCRKGDTTVSVDLSPLLSDAQRNELHNSPNSNDVYVTVAKEMNKAVIKIADYGLKHLKKRKKHNPPTELSPGLQARIDSAFLQSFFILKILSQDPECFAY